MLLAFTFQNQLKDNKYDIIVAKDGSGDYTTIQSAIEACKSFPYERIKIFIKNGIYHEKVFIPSWNTKISMIGESEDSTIISFDDYFKKIVKGPNSTFYTPTLLVQGNDFYAKNLTIENTAGPVGQAVALSVEADRCSFKNCKLLGNQDTLYLAGEHNRQYFSNCYIEGTTDFIFGEATVLFEKCVIKSKANSYITAASTPQHVSYGFVFKDCALEAASDVDKVFLGRPWRRYAKTVFLNCNMGSFIQPEGWSNWAKTDNFKTVFYAEYKSRQMKANLNQRVPWAHQLNKEQAEKYTLKNIFAGQESWNPNDLNN
ncbi:MAG: pectinesterase family protein [Bacteroidota bacterium]|nr:pectinesterase family protein [Bacteroidota bacterium]